MTVATIYGFVKFWNQIIILLAMLGLRVHLRLSEGLS
jgi:hypothetical protein